MGLGTCLVLLVVAYFFRYGDNFLPLYLNFNRLFTGYTVSLVRYHINHALKDRRLYLGRFSHDFRFSSLYFALLRLFFRLASFLLALFLLFMIRAILVSNFLSLFGFYSEL